MQTKDATQYKNIFFNIDGSLLTISCGYVKLFCNQSLNVKTADNNVYAASTLYHSFVRKDHPILPAVLRCAGLAQRPRLFHHRDKKLGPGPLVDQIGGE